VTGPAGHTSAGHIVGRNPAALGRPIPATRPRVAPRPSARPSTSQGRLALQFFAFTAAAAFVLVTVVDPYSGATASPYFQVPSATVPGASAERYDGQSAQKLLVSSTVANAVTVDGYTVVEPEPEPEPVVPTFSAGSAAVPDPGSAQAYAYGAVAARGWGGDQYNCLVSLWNKESGWRVNANNASSGAYGIPQSLPGSKMASAGADWQTNPATQIEWGLGYISGRYGTPCGAWGHSVDIGWY
jgi:hypothetical protein